MKYGIMFTLTLCLAALSPGLCMSGDNRRDVSKQSIMDLDLICERGYEEMLEPWGHSGYSRGCHKGDTRHGRWLYWEEGYLNLEGFYRNGKKHGTWTVFNMDDSIFVKIFFENGVKIIKEFY